MKKIKLGTKVRCKITGFVGIATARTEFINGCVQYIVVPKIDKDNKLQDDLSIDQGSLEVISDKKKPIEIEEEDTGGKTTRGIKHRGY